MTFTTRNPGRRRNKSLSWRDRCLWISVVAMFVLLLPVEAPSESVPSTPQVRGELVMLTSELVVVKSADGTSILIPLGRDTRLDQTLKVGDRVEVVVTPDNHVSSVTKLTPEPLR